MVKKAFILVIVMAASMALAQGDWIKTGTGLGVEKVRLATPDFKTTSSDARTADLLKTFNDTLWSDLDNAGIFDMVSKSFYPLAQPGQPAEVRLDAWGNPPPNASMLAFGNLNVSGNDLAVMGWLYDVKNAQSPQVLGKQYHTEPTAAGARLTAHRFADEIIFRLGGGISGIAESKIFFVSTRTGNKEVWMMDYDGEAQTRLTKDGSIALSPAVSPDGSRVAYVSFTSGNADLAMYSLELGRKVTFPHFGGANTSPAWTPDGKLLFSSAMRGDPEIFQAEASGGNARRLTNYRGPDVQPTINRKSGGQIAWVSGRTGLPQIYVMDGDGANVQRLTDEGYAVSPSWSPNGQLLAFSWIRHYGPGAPGGQDIYIMDVTTHQFVQLTHEAGRNDFPSWSPDGRHIVFQSNRNGGDQIWTMLADGTKQHQLTSSGKNTQPDWSWK
ncbi:MAG TPA: Tol-Pal system beta propeller repeat protein TolB [Terriglobales bacterium]|nr:Tol-Pal system beta propeller repeat protein TolB [Terriglobales bacterium]